MTAMRLSAFMPRSATPLPPTEVARIVSFHGAKRAVRIAPVGYRPVYALQYEGDEHPMNTRLVRAIYRWQEDGRSFK